MILVTGATGFIGRAIVARLLAASRAVVVLARSRDGVEARTRVAEVFGRRPVMSGCRSSRAISRRSSRRSGRPTVAGCARAWRP
jgi:nucleoside-diphosphate-sugar epimerase